MPVTLLARGAGLAVLYVALCALPLMVALIGPRPDTGRGFWTELGVALGFVGLSMMGVQFALTARFPGISTRLGQDTLLQFHKIAGMLAAGFVLGHQVVLVLADAAFRAFYDPRVNLMRAAALTTANAAILALILLPFLRARLGLAYEWWRLTHGVLAALVMLIAAAHVVMVGRYASPPLKAAVFVLLSCAPLALLGHVRLLRPWLLRSHPYRVVDVRRERDGVWTVAVEPAGRPLRFEAGQFAWVTFGDSPLALRQHPFTIASSAERPERLEFAIKELGDFTATIGSLPIGSTAFIEGPAGNFTLPPAARGAVLIAGGIGITPAISMLRTMADRADPRPATLIYANATLDKAIFAEELDALARSLALRVLHVPERPPEGWNGPSGYMTRAMLAEHLSREELDQRHFLVCGPDAMMDAVEGALHELGVARDRVRVERFDVT